MAVPLFKNCTTKLHCTGQRHYRVIMNKFGGNKTTPKPPQTRRSTQRNKSSDGYRYGYTCTIQTGTQTQVFGRNIGYKFVKTNSVLLQTFQLTKLKST